jgi:murein DD-endopeptidase MepM/ murein hydrolase activator NlpD
MEDLSMMKNLKTIMGILLLAVVLIGFIDPLAAGAQGEFALPFELGSVNVSSAPGAGTYHTHGPSSEAIDFDLPSGTTIYPTKPGVVTEAAYGWNDGYGNLVQVRHHDGTISIYGHLSSIFVKKDQPVGRSTELGESGNSGSVSPPPSPGCTSCGDHLHFEVRNPDQSAGVNVQYLVDWNEGCPGCSDPIKGTAGGDPRQLFLLDSFLYNSSEKTATSTLVLDAGRTYLLTVTGTFSFWSPSQWGDWLGDNADRMCWGIAEEDPLIPSPGDRTGPVGADPEYQYAVPIYPGGCPDGPTDSVEPRPSASVQLSLDGGAVFLKIVTTNDDFNSRHKYQYLVEGNGPPLLISILDSGYSDNYGQLQVGIELYQ